MHVLPLVFVLLAASGCTKREALVQIVDRATFQRIGATVFANPGKLSMKEIHLESSSWRGKEIVIEGRIASISDHSTYLVLTDEQARMLVVLTKLESEGERLRRERAGAVRVLGVVESGQKGLPYFVARSINVVQNPGKA